MGKIRKKNAIDKCGLCGKEYKHHAWDKQKYCSRKCAWSSKKIKTHCAVCKIEKLVNKALHARNEKFYCSRECYNHRFGTPRRIKRHTAFFDNLLENASCFCGINAKFLLAVHHIDGNVNNNDSANHEIVCATCHILRHLRKNKKGEWVYHTKSLTPRELIPVLTELYIQKDD